ncbi:MAG: ABC transporter permease [Bacteroidetes bacterium]|nr:ABC transporter permease [Rhodothermia bacterium]MCS7156033.1 ABC transporter permease [Bacteroidota bacterium]MCX7907721.1 ABC transporter permease [Bacteroidota bacterium]MDW8137850.1 ABC transporter permease [Bacteroidota bacterium]MDW8286299.1 ABC transporter permease [Bacteroidota bacterium]
MGRYLVRRLAGGGLLLMLLSWLAFALRSCMPGDPALQRLVQEGQRAPAELERELALYRARMGLDRPPFYVHLGTWADPPYWEPNPERRALLVRRARREGGWRAWIPRLFWHGADNQYHRWLSGLWRGDWGVSYRDGRPVWALLRERLPVTVALSGLSLLFTLVLAVGIGAYLGMRRFSRVDRLGTVALLVLYALPSFWIATLLLMLFASGGPLGVFPSGGVFSPEHRPDWPWYRRLADVAWHLALPVAVYVLSALPYAVRQVQSAVAELMASELVLALRARGLSERRLLWAHVLPNALLPVLTWLGGIFAGFLSGSVIVETVFSIPGMGQAAYEAILARDYPVVLAVMLLGGVMTVLSLLLTDLLYAWADPRIRLEGRR